MKNVLSLFLAIALAGCSTSQKQATYKTLSAASSALNIGSSAWKSYVVQAKADDSVSKETLVRQSIQVRDAVAKASGSLEVAIDIAETTDGAVPEEVAKAISDALFLINQFKK